ncbi:Uncharacterised protein [Bordetella pertussis]|nr:Uncharacterised protein [Bordetella pertussis]
MYNYGEPSEEKRQCKSGYLKKPGMGKPASRQRQRPSRST